MKPLASMKERPDLLERCRAMFGAELEAVLDEDQNEPAGLHNEGIMIETGSAFLLRFKNRTVRIWISEWGGFELAED